MSGQGCRADSARDFNHAARQAANDIGWPVNAITTSSHAISRSRSMRPESQCTTGCNTKSLQSPLDEKQVVVIADEMRGFMERNLFEISIAQFGNAANREQDGRAAGPGCHRHRYL